MGSRSATHTVTTGWPRRWPRCSQHDPRLSSSTAGGPGGPRPRARPTSSPTVQPGSPPTGWLASSRARGLSRVRDSTPDTCSLAFLFCTLAVTYPTRVRSIYGRSFAGPGRPEPTHGPGDPARSPGHGRRVGQALPIARPGFHDTWGSCGRPDWSTSARRRSAGSTACGPRPWSRSTTGCRTTARCGRTGSTRCTRKSLEERRHENDRDRNDEGARRDPGSGAGRRRYDTDINDLWQACTTPERLGRWIAEVSGDSVRAHRPGRLHEHLDRPGDDRRVRRSAPFAAHDRARAPTTRARSRPGSPRRVHRPAWWWRSADCPSTSSTSTEPDGTPIWRISAAPSRVVGRCTRRAGRRGRPPPGTSAGPN